MSNKINETEWIWKNGEFVGWWDANVHILCHSLQFGSSMFEGIRCYATPDGPAIFRLGEHLRRLVDSCRIYRMELGFDVPALTEGCRELVRRNRVDACYLRPMVLRGYGAAGMNPVGSPVESYLVCWPWGTYLGEGALEQGVDVCVSNWQRQEPNTYPAHAKAAGNYLNGQLSRMQAQADGYADAIALGPGGLVSEGSGQNIFLVRDGALLTPALDGTNLPGITRDSILTIARDMGITVRETQVPRETLYTADELFFTGTAAELTPIRSVDRIPVGRGSMGPLTRELQRRYLDIARGNAPDPYGWLTYVNDRRAAVA
ncbi:MAG: branched-chain amino acid transaminase [Gemmatimonadetes bacterium]|nr:branched-chain amino acid transaminase [Gemmatimonadota bacterium]